MRILLGVIAIVFSSTAIGQTPTDLNNQQASIVYDQCLARAAVRVSRTNSPDVAIYGLAKQECAATRDSLFVGHEKDVERARIIAAIDAEKEANFPALTKQVRERRKAFEAQLGSPK